MRISHDKKFVFLATPRTGSTTLRDVLDPYSDIRSVHISQISPDFPFYHHISARELKCIFAQRGWNWDDYTKFCVVRNPFDRTVSLYHHNLKMRRDAFGNRPLDKLRYRFSKKPTFAEYVRDIDPNERLPTSLQNFACDDAGRQLVDDILRFEDLATEIPRQLAKIGIALAADAIPHLNASECRGAYRDYYDAETRAKIDGLYQYEISRFNYSF